jgi:hypothetical protein
VRVCLPLHTYIHTCIYSEREGGGREGVKETERERERGHRERDRVKERERPYRERE